MADIPDSTIRDWIDLAETSLGKNQPPGLGAYEVIMALGNLILNERQIVRDAIIKLGEVNIVSVKEPEPRVRFPNLITQEGEYTNG